MAPLEILELYGYRFKIELGFKQAVHVIGAYGYHFWMKGMKRVRRGGGLRSVRWPALRLQEVKQGGLVAENDIEAQPRAGLQIRTEQMARPEQNVLLGGLVGQLGGIGNGRVFGPQENAGLGFASERTHL